MASYCIVAYLENIAKLLICYDYQETTSLDLKSLT